jgi:hypothetical protein
MHTPWLLVALHIEYFILTPKKFIWMFVWRRKRDLRKGNRKREKGKSLLPPLGWAGSDPSFSPSLPRARAHGVRPRCLPSSWAVWAHSPAAPRARARAGPKSPRAQLTEILLFPFLFSFSYFLIYVYRLIFYAPKIVQIFLESQNNNWHTLLANNVWCTVFARRRGVRPSGIHSSRIRVGARPLGNRSFVPRELWRRQVHSSLDA